MVLDKLDLFEAHWISGPRHICLQASDQMILCWPFCGNGIGQIGSVSGSESSETKTHLFAKL
jgi:hypothetical protein